MIASTFLYALHSAVVKRFGGDIPFGEFLFYRVTAVAAVLFVLAAAQNALVWPTAVGWGWLLLAGTVNVVVSRGLYYLALGRMGMSVLTIILTVTPVVTWAWSMAIFGAARRVESGGWRRCRGLSSPRRAGMLGRSATRLGRLRAIASRPRNAGNHVTHVTS